jgi:anti-anti-sigma factor
VPLLTLAVLPTVDRVVVRLSGDSDLSTRPVLEEALHRARDLGSAQVELDVAAVRFWDCSGLQTLSSFTARLAAAGRRCVVVGASGRTRRLIDLAGFGGSLQLDARA